VVCLNEGPWLNGGLLCHGEKLPLVFCGRSQKFYVGIMTEVSCVTHLRQNTGSLNFSNFGIICQAKKSAEIRKYGVIFYIFNGVFLTLRLLMYIYGAPSKARSANVVYIWT